MLVNAAPDASLRELKWFVARAAVVGLPCLRLMSVCMLPGHLELSVRKLLRHGYLQV